MHLLDFSLVIIDGLLDQLQLETYGCNQHLAGGQKRGGTTQGEVP